MISRKELDELLPPFLFMLGLAMMVGACSLIFIDVLGKSRELLGWVLLLLLVGGPLLIGSISHMRYGRFYGFLAQKIARRTRKK